MIAFNLPKCIAIMMVVLLALGSHSTVEAARRNEIKDLLSGANFAQTILRVKMEPCTSCKSCAVDCTQGCKSCTTDADIF